MPRRSYPAVSPVLSEIAKAIYGDVDLREIGLVSKNGMPGSSDVHVESPARQKKVAQTGLAATGVASVAGVHAISATRSENRLRADLAAGRTPEAHQTGKAMKLIGRVAPKLNPTKAAAIIGGGALALHGVELLGDGLGMHAQAKALRAANAAQAAQPAQPGQQKKTVTKAFSLKPLNIVTDHRIPSLRAKRIRTTPSAGSPKAKTGLYQPVSKAETIEVVWEGEISKIDTEHRQVFGWASVSKLNGQDVVDLQGDVVPIEEIEKSAYKYVIESRKGGDMHKRVSKFAADEPLHTADMIESFVVTPEKLEKMGLPADALPHGWWVGYHVNDDEQWANVKSGKRAGFSIHGSGTRTPTGVSKAYPNETLPQSDDAHEPPARTEAKKRIKLRTRASQAINPPAVKLKPVRSTAIASMGYQKQTRRMAYEMGSRKGQPYLYKMKPGEARAALDSPSLGRHYATEVRGKVPRSKHVGVAGRARLFADPVSKNIAVELAGAPVDIANARAALKPKRNGAPNPPVAGTAKMVLKPITSTGTTSPPPPPVPAATIPQGTVTSL